MADLIKPDPSKYKNTPEDQARLAQDIQAFEAQELAKANAKGQLAPQVTLTGTITAVSSRIGDAPGFHLISISGKDERIMIGGAIMENNASMVRVGKKVVITAEKRTAHVTGYKDKRDGDKWKPHTGSGLNFLSIALQEQQAELEANSADKAGTRLETLAKLEATRVAILQSLDPADKTAYAAMMQGSVSFAI